MPPVVAAAAIGGAAALGGAALSSRSAGRASEAQSRATNDALKFERENEARRRQEYDESVAMQKAQWEAKERSRLGMLARFGVPVGQARPMPGPDGAPVAPGGSGLTLGSLTRGLPGSALVQPNSGDWRAAMRPGQTLASIGDWTRWGGR